MELKDIIVSAFPNAKIKDNPTHFPLLDILDNIRKGSIKKQIETIHKEKDHGKQNQLKLKLLPVFCPSGTFERMEDSKLVKMSGVICIDLDDVPNLKTEKDRLKAFPYVLSILKSPSGKGLKIMVLHDMTEPSRHKDLYHYIGSLLGLTTRTDLVFDMSCSNISHPCFWSYDSSLYLNRKATPLHIDLNRLPSCISSKGKTISSKGKALKTAANSTVTPLTDPKEIRNKLLESHTLFEEYYSMYPNVRNKNLLILASFFYNDGIPENVATDYLIVYYSDSKNGFPASEIKSIVHSAYH